MSDVGWFTPTTPPPPAEPSPVTVCQCGEPIEIGQPYDALVRNREHEDENGNYHIASTTAIARWHLACGDRIEITATLRSAPADVPDGHNPAPAEVV